MKFRLRMERWAKTEYASEHEYADTWVLEVKRWWGWLFKTRCATPDEAFEKAKLIVSEESWTFIIDPNGEVFWKEV